MVACDLLCTNSVLFSIKNVRLENAYLLFPPLPGAEGIGTTCPISRQ